MSQPSELQVGTNAWWRHNGRVKSCVIQSIHPQVKACVILVGLGSTKVDWRVGIDEVSYVPPATNETASLKEQADNALELDVLDELSRTSPQTLRHMVKTLEVAPTTLYAAGQRLMVFKKVLVETKNYRAGEIPAGEDKALQQPRRLMVLSLPKAAPEIPPEP